MHIKLSQTVPMSLHNFIICIGFTASVCSSQQQGKAKTKNQKKVTMVKIRDENFGIKLLEFYKILSSLREKCCGTWTDESCILSCLK